MIPIANDCGVSDENETLDFVTENMICAGGQDNKGFCYGDEGGPLVTEGPDGTVILTGSFELPYYFKGFGILLLIFQVLPASGDQGQNVATVLESIPKLPTIWILSEALFLINRRHCG